MSERFPGFSKSALTFFRQLKQHNDRDWFVAHKPKFRETIHEPMVALIARLQSKMIEIAPDYVYDPKRAIYRIYRDTRFSRDKTPFKLHYGAQFQHPKVTKNLGGGYYFHISATEVAVGGGFYMPGPEELLALRLALVRDEKKVRSILADKKLVKSMGMAQGDSAARVPKLFESTPESRHDLVKRKQLYFYADLDPALALSSKLEDELLKRFRLISPWITWINTTLIAAIRKEAGEEESPRRPPPMF